MLADFLKGFHYLLEGFTLIRLPALRPFIWVPLLCNVVLYSLLMVVAGYGLHHFSSWIVQFLPRWLQWLHWLVWIASWLFSGFVLLYLSTILINLVAGPFNSVLAERVLIYLQAHNNVLPVGAWRAISGSFLRQIQFLGYYLPRAIVYLLFFLLPLIQVVATVLWFLFNGWVFTMQFLDFPMDLHGISISQMRQLMLERQGLCLGFGCGVVLFAMIPLINLVIIPVAVAGASLLWAKEYRTRIQR